MNETRRSDWLIKHAPLPLLTHAYELVLAVVLCILAIPVLFGRIEPTSIHAAVQPWMAYTWAWFLLAGAILTAVGLFVPQYPRTEWSGQVILGMDLSLYAIAIATAGARGGGLAAAIFFALGALGFWRAYKVSHPDAVRERVASWQAELLVRIVKERTR